MADTLVIPWVMSKSKAGTGVVSSQWKTYPISGRITGTSTMIHVGCFANGMSGVSNGVQFDLSGKVVRRNGKMQSQEVYVNKVEK
jgi:hypothetical protein